MGEPNCAEFPEAVLVSDRKMDSFEQLVAEILWLEGHWVQTSFRVELTKEEKVRIKRASSPRWELDVIAFSGGDNVLRVVECKSFLDSRGVGAGAFDGSDEGAAKRYKLFNDRVLRETVFSRLRKQLAGRGAIPPNTKIQLCLACGRIPNDNDRARIRRHFRAKGWALFDEHWLKERLQAMAKSGYENRMSAVVAKLLLRGKLDQPVEAGEED
jgi:hypothetical protein